MNEPIGGATGLWCLIANVAAYQEYGEAREIRLGTKHFSPGTKVYCFPPRWGDGYEQITVVGRHRGGAKLATLVMPSKRLTNWRAKVVYQPHVVRLLAEHPWRQADAEGMAASCVLWEGARQAIRQGLSFSSPDAALVFAALSGREAEIEAALARGANVNATHLGWTPLAVATCYGGPELIERLLALGADPALPTALGLTPSALASGRGAEGIAHLLDRSCSSAFLRILRMWWRAMRADDEA